MNKEDLVLNSLQVLGCHKAQPNQSIARLGPVSWASHPGPRTYSSRFEK